MSSSTATRTLTLAPALHKGRHMHTLRATPPHRKSPPLRVCGARRAVCGRACAALYPALPHAASRYSPPQHATADSNGNLTTRPLPLPLLDSVAGRAQSRGAVWQRPLLSRHACNPAHRPTHAHAHQALTGSTPCPARCRMVSGEKARVGRVRTAWQALVGTATEGGSGREGLGHEMQQVVSLVWDRETSRKQKYAV